MDFTFADATRWCLTLASLASAMSMSSPILTARPGSMHGYDVTLIRPRVNPELGGEDGLRDLVAALRQAGMGLIVDIVPNHMAAGGLENPWWGDVLRHGRAAVMRSSSISTGTPRDPALHGKVLAPFLGEPYGEALRSRRDQPVREQRGEPVIRYFDTSFPIRPEDHAEIAAADADAYDPATEAGRARLSSPAGAAALPSRLVALRGRRDQLAAVFRYQRPGRRCASKDDEVFDATHATLLRLYGEGLIDGVRVDHVDGLADPPGYCRRLRARLEALETQRPPDAPRGRAGWSWRRSLAPATSADRLEVDGTSGYDFMDEVNALLHDHRRGGRCASYGHRSVAGPRTSRTRKCAARQRSPGSRFHVRNSMRVTSALHRVAARNRNTRDTTFASIRRALLALLSHFPVYRGYGCRIAAIGMRPSCFAKALAGAKRECRAADHPVVSLSWIGWLGGEPGDEAGRRPRFSSSARRSRQKPWKTQRSIATACYCRAMMWVPISLASACPCSDFMRPARNGASAFRMRCWRPLRMTTSAAKMCGRGLPC